MKVVVLGSGVIGVSVAWYLARAGHEVQVIERQDGAGLETSFGNAGEVSPGYSSPWAGPGVPLKAIKWMLMQHSPLVIWPLLEAAMWRWGAMMLANCTERAYALNKSRMVPIAEYSRDCLKALRAEPALVHTQEKFVGALRLPGDETGDCHLFTQRLAAMAAAQGVRFDYGTRILGLESEGSKVGAVHTSAGRVSGDAYIAALGSYTPLLLKPLGIDLPVYPVKGYSITVPITDAAGAPESTVMDETHKVAVTRLGDRIRVGGTAELAGYDLRLRTARRATLEHVVTDLFPHGGDVSRASFWCGLRPMTPDGTPLVGGTPYSNLYLSTGHGTLGWTMAAGTGRVMADLLSGRQPEISLEGLTMARYTRAFRGHRTYRPALA